MDKSAQELALVMRFIAIGVRVLSARILLFLTVLLAFALFAWAMFVPRLETVGIAAAFALLVFWPVIKLDIGLTQDRKAISPTSEVDE